MNLTSEQIEYEAHLNNTEKEVADRMNRETHQEQPYKDNELNFIYPFFESQWDIDEYNQDYEDWLHHEAEVAV